MFIFLAMGILFVCSFVIHLIIAPALIFNSIAIFLASFFVAFVYALAAKFSYSILEILVLSGAYFLIMHWGIFVYSGFSFTVTHFSLMFLFFFLIMIPLAIKKKWI